MDPQGQLNQLDPVASNSLDEEKGQYFGKEDPENVIGENGSNIKPCSSNLNSVSSPKLSLSDGNSSVNNNKSNEDMEQILSAKPDSSVQLDETLIIESDEEMKQEDNTKSNSDNSPEKSFPDDICVKKSLSEISLASTVDMRDVAEVGEASSEDIKDFVEVSQATTVDIKDLGGSMPYSPEDLFASQSISDNGKPQSENSIVEYEDFIPSSLSTQSMIRVNSMEDTTENMSTPRKRKLEDGEEEQNETKVPKLQSSAVPTEKEKNDSDHLLNEKECSKNETVTSESILKKDTVASAVSLNGEKYEQIEENFSEFKEPNFVRKEKSHSTGGSSKQFSKTSDTRKSVEIIFSSVEDSILTDKLTERGQDLLTSVPEENGEEFFQESDDNIDLQMSLSPTQATQSFLEADISRKELDKSNKLSPLKTNSTETSSNGHNDIDGSGNGEKDEPPEDDQHDNDQTSHENSDIQIISPDVKKTVGSDTILNKSESNMSVKSIPGATDDIVILDEINSNDVLPTKCKEINGPSMHEIHNTLEDNNLDKQDINKLDVVLDRDVQKHPQLSNTTVNDRTPDPPLLLPNKDNTSVNLKELDITLTLRLKCRVQITEESKQLHSLEVSQLYEIEDSPLNNLNHQENSSGYVADDSKNSSPSSVVSVGPFALKAPSWRLSSSSTSTVSSGHSGIGGRSRSSDWHFVAPLKPAPSRNLRGRNIHYSSEFERDLLELIERKITADDDPNQFPSKNILPASMLAASSSAPPTEEREGPKESSNNKIDLEEHVPETPKSTKKLTRGARNTRNASRNLVAKIKEVKEEESSPQTTIENEAGETTGSNKRPRKTPIRSSKRAGNSTPSTPVVPEDTKVSTLNGSANRSRRNRSITTQNEKVESNSHESSHVYHWDLESCFSKLVSEAPVFARWSDRKYYPGKIKEKSKEGWTVEFDDKAVSSVKDEFIIPINILTKGQIVFASTKEVDEQGVIVEFKLEDGEVLYGVDLDSGKKSFYPRSKLFMTEDQARILQENMDPKSPTTSSPALTTVSCDNIVHTKRPRSNRVLFGASESPSVSGVLKTPKRLGKADPSHDTSCSSSVSDTNDKGAPLVLEEVSGVDPEVPSFFPEPLPASGGRGKGPGRIKSKTRTPRRNTPNQSLRENKGDNELYEILGPIPEGNKIFNGMCFLLTHSGVKTVDNLKISNSSKSRKKSDRATSGSEYEEVSTDDGIGPCKIPFIKDYLKKQIEAGGGIVFEHFEDLPENQYQNTFLVADRPSLTAKFILCLASGIRIINHQWVIEEAKGSSRPWNGARLLAGWDLEGQRYVDPEATVRTRKQKPLNKKEVGLVNDSQAFVKYWGRVLELLGASVRHITPEQDREFSGVNVIVTDNSCPPEVQERAREWSIPLVSTTWVTQSLINWRIRPYTGHPHYRFDYCASE